MASTAELVDVERKGSARELLVLQAEVERATEREDDARDAARGATGRSSTGGGAMPSSVYNQSICTIVADNCPSRFA